MSFFYELVSDAEGTGLDAAYIGGIAYRYFLMNNFSLGVSINVLYQSNSYTAETAAGTIKTESEDLGFVGFITANYYVRLGNSLFFKPGLGLGGLYGRRTVPTPGGAPGQTTQMALYGGTARLDLGFVFFASRHFNLRAGLDILFRVGAANPADDTMETQSFFSIDAGFNIGLGYTF